MITVQTIPLFQTSVAYGKILGFDKKNLITEILKLEKNSPSNFRSNAGGFQSLAVDINVPDNRYVSELFNDVITPILNEVAVSWGFPIAKNLTYWYNVNRRYNNNNRIECGESKLTTYIHVNQKLKIWNKSK